VSLELAKPPAERGLRASAFRAARRQSRPGRALNSRRSFRKPPEKTKSTQGKPLVMSKYLSRRWVVRKDYLVLKMSNITLLIILEEVAQRKVNLNAHLRSRDSLLNPCLQILTSLSVLPLGVVF